MCAMVVVEYFAWQGIRCSDGPVLPPGKQGSKYEVIRWLCYFVRDSTCSPQTGVNEHSWHLLAASLNIIPSAVFSRSVKLAVWLENYNAASTRFVRYRDLFFEGVTSDAPILLKLRVCFFVFCFIFKWVNTLNPSLSPSHAYIWVKCRQSHLRLLCSLLIPVKCWYVYVVYSLLTI